MSRASQVSADWVQAHRAKGRGWQSIAAMAGVAEVDLRLRFGGLDPADHPGSRPPALTPQQRVEVVMREKGLAEDQAVIIGRLYEARGNPLKRPGLTRDADLPNSDGGRMDYQRRQFLLRTKKAAEKLGLVVEIGSRGTVLSADSLVRLRRMIGGAA